MNRLAQNLKLIRKVRWRISQDRFSQMMESTRSKINSYENGGVEPSIAFVLKLESFTKLTVKEIFYEDLNLEQIPPYPLEEGQFFAAEPVVQTKDIADIKSVLKNQNQMKHLLQDLSSKLNIIEKEMKKE